MGNLETAGKFMITLSRGTLEYQDDSVQKFPEELLNEILEIYNSRHILTHMQNRKREISLDTICTHELLKLHTYQYTVSRRHVSGW